MSETTGIGARCPMSKGYVRLGEKPHSNKTRCANFDGRHRSEMPHVKAEAQRDEMSYLRRCGIIGEMLTRCWHRCEMPYVKAYEHQGKKPSSNKDGRADVSHGPISAWH